MQASYAHYAGKYNESQIGANTPVGEPDASSLFDYIGPAGQGRDFAPGFDPRELRGRRSASFPTANVFLDDGLSSPVTREFTASIGHELWGKGLAKVTYVYRNYYNFIEDFIDDPSDAGKHRPSSTTAPTSARSTTSLFDNSDAPERNYQALLLPGELPLPSRTSRSKGTGRFS